MKVETGLICNMLIGYKGTNVDPGRRIRLCRHLRGIECKELATKVGISPTYMSKIERNRTKAPMERYESIAMALGMTIDQMFGVEPLRNLGTISEFY